MTIDGKTVSEILNEVQDQDDWRNPIRVNWRLKDFCAAYGISRATFYRECKAGRLWFIKSGKSTLIPDAVAKQWQEARISEANKSEDS